MVQYMFQPNSQHKRYIVKDGAPALVKKDFDIIMGVFFSSHIILTFTSTFWFQDSFGSHFTNEKQCSFYKIKGMFSYRIQKYLIG